MRTRRWQALALSLLGVLGASAVSAQREETPPRRLDPDVVAVRLLLGVGDGQVQTWGGKVTIDKGEVLGVEGYRFRKGDRVIGRDAWEARSHLIRKAAAKKKAAPKAAVAKAGGTGHRRGWMRRHSSGR